MGNPEKTVSEMRATLRKMAASLRNIDELLSQLLTSSVDEQFQQCIKLDEYVAQMTLLTEDLSLDTDIVIHTLTESHMHKESK